MLVGNERGKEGLEITLSGPELRFLGPAVVALTGAPIEAKLDDDEFPMWTRYGFPQNSKAQLAVGELAPTTAGLSELEMLRYIC